MDNRFNIFNSRFADILDIEKEDLNEDFKLDSASFDSLAILSMSALIVDLFEIELNKEKLAKCNHFSDLLKLIKNEIKLKDANN